MTREEVPSFFGALISWAVFFGVLFFSLYKEKYLADKKRNLYFDEGKILRIKDGLSYWILALGFGFLRRSTDYIHVVEDRYDDYSPLPSNLTPPEPTDTAAVASSKPL